MGSDSQAGLKPKAILFLDSGVGGLPYLETARLGIPSACFHYLADDAGFPYGVKTPGEVTDLLLDRVRRIRSRLNVDALVIACNTASQIGLSALRAANPDIPIIGTVPAVKPAAADSVSGCIGVLATERTVVDPYIDDLIARYASDVDVVKLPAQALVDFVEHRFLSSTDLERQSAVAPYVKKLVDAGADRIVLACTHFLHLRSDIAYVAEKLGARHMGIIDSREGVANRLEELLGESADKEDNFKTAVGRFFLTGEPPFDPAYGLWASRFNLGFPERL